MADAPDWPKVLSLTVHEFRTPLTVVAGYLRMLSTERVGELTENQKRVVLEAEKSCARLSSLLTEVSEVAHFHQGRLSFLRTPVALASVLDGVALPDAPERSLSLVREGTPGDATVDGDATRLRQALSSVAAAVGREIIDGASLFLIADIRAAGGGREAFLAFGSEAVARDMIAAPVESLSSFDATRGGSGLSLVVARQVLEDHGARLFGASGDHPRAGAAITLPLSN
jgi:signal transduction histidine kinase